MTTDAPVTSVSTFILPVLIFRYSLIVSKLNSDIQVIEDTLGSNFSMFSRCLLQIITSLIIMLIISPILSGVTWGGILPLVLFSMIY